MHAIDIETNGTDFTNPATIILGVGIANSEGVWYLSRPPTRTEWQFICTLPLVSHNALFDAAFIQRDSGVRPNYVGCTFILYKLYATEGFMGQQWSVDSLVRNVLGWSEADSQKVWLATALKHYKLRKDQMWKLAELEPEQFANYCGLDAEACYQGWVVFQSLSQDAPRLFMPFLLTEMWLLIEQQWRGIQIDMPCLERYHQQLVQDCALMKSNFLQHSEVRPHVRSYNAAVLAQLQAKEPPQITKTGKVSKRWEAWTAKYADAMVQDHFNINSGDHLRWLFYEKLGHKISRTTDSGIAQIDSKLLPSLGAAGRVLHAYRKLTKEEGYVYKCKQMVDADGVLHPQFKLHGTVTGRLGGAGGFNLQQQPKAYDYLSGFKARPGFKLVQMDMIASEPAILAEASKDPTLWRLYGPGAAANDVYLFVGSHISAFREKIRRYYDPENPTVDGISKAKKNCKRERGICKTIHLAKQYGAGPHKIYSTLIEAGEDVSLADIVIMSREWNELFAGLKTFERQLQEEWHANGGTIKNGVGRTMAVDEFLLKDVVNRFAQSTSHDILLLILQEISTLRTADRVEMYPWIVDFHDEWIFEVPERMVDKCTELYRTAVARVNEILQYEIPVRCEPQVASHLGEIKDPEREGTKRRRELLGL